MMGLMSLQAVHMVFPMKRACEVLPEDFPKRIRYERRG